MHLRSTCARALASLGLVLGAANCNVILGLDKYVDGNTGGAGGSTSTTTSSTSTTSSSGTGGAMGCTPNEPVACYDGPPGTEGNGHCKGGMKTCAMDGSGFGACMGQSLPEPAEDCGTVGDEDCDGVACSDPVSMILFDNSNYVGVLGLAIDPQGNTIIAGNFTVSATFGSFNLISAGALDYFVMKVAPSGTVLWAKRYGDANGNGSNIRVATDFAGNVLLAGGLKGTADFGGGPLTATSTTNEDVFVVKLDPSGNYKWGNTFGDTSVQIARDIAVDSQGDVILGGAFSGSINFGGATLMSTTSLSDAFLVKLASANGAHLWSHPYHEATGKGASVQTITTIAVDGSDNIGVGGQAVANVNNSINLGGMDLVGNSNPLIFAAKYDSAGNHNWSQAFAPPDLNTGIGRISLDKVGALILTGVFSGTMDFGAGAITSSGSDIFVTKFSAAGAAQWSKAIANTASAFTLRVAADGANDIVLSTTAGTTVSLTKLSGAGTQRWSKLLPGSATLSGNEIAIYPTSNRIALVAGEDMGTIDFGPPTTSAMCGGGKCTAFAIFQP